MTPLGISGERDPVRVGGQINGTPAYCRDQPTAILQKDREGSKNAGTTLELLDLLMLQSLTFMDNLPMTGSRKKAGLVVYSKACATRAFFRDPHL